MSQENSTRDAALAWARQVLAFLAVFERLLRQLPAIEDGRSELALRPGRPVLSLESLANAADKLPTADEDLRVCLSQCGAWFQEHNAHLQRIDALYHCASIIIAEEGPPDAEWALKELGGIPQQMGEEITPVFSHVDAIWRKLISALVEQYPAGFDERRRLGSAFDQWSRFANQHLPATDVLQIWSFLRSKMRPGWRPDVNDPLAKQLHGIIRVMFESRSRAARELDLAGGDLAGGDLAGGDLAGGDLAGGDLVGGDRRPGLVDDRALIYDVGAGGDLAGDVRDGGDLAGGDRRSGLVDDRAWAGSRVFQYLGWFCLIAFVSWYFFAGRAHTVHRPSTDDSWHIDGDGIVRIDGTVYRIR